MAGNSPGGDSTAPDRAAAWDKPASAEDRPANEGAGKNFVDNPFDDTGNLKANIKYQSGEFNYNYETDSLGRLEVFQTDDLRLTERTDRLPHNPNTPGKLPGDHAGHLAGDRFGGSSELDNLVSQSSDINLSQYKKIENQWAKAISEGKKVQTQVRVKYQVNSSRPSKFIIDYSIDGEYYSQTLVN
ncbi:MAG: DNA/RNA non-specific endonuclease [Clostridiaceae bacterium]|nr:DNA/RNA non-specific endonuclease [Clostridiaceae bacterium]